MPKIGELLTQMKKELRPLWKKLPEVDDLLKKITALLKEQKIKAVVQTGGSYSKGTALKNIHDIDLFVAFDLTYKEKNISDLLEKALKPLNPTRVHGSRDYFQIHNLYNIEIIPVLNIKKASDAQNVTDFSLWHVEWVMKKGKGKEDDIRLAKQFCKAASIYGAESYISGFSGHVLDILIIYYGSFEKLLKGSLTWKAQKVIDPHNQHKGKALFNLNKSKIQSGLVVIDPVQPDRNAAAALSIKNMLEFQKVAQQFLKTPTLEFFKEKKINLDMLKKKKAIILLAETQEGKRDVVGAKAVKVYEHFKNALQEIFGIKESGWQWNDQFIMWFIPEKKMLPPTKEHIGPPLDKEKHVISFKKKYKKTTIKKEYTNPVTLVKSLIAEEYTKDKIKKIMLAK